MKAKIELVDNFNEMSYLDRYGITDDRNSNIFKIKGGILWFPHNCSLVTAYQCDNLIGCQTCRYFTFGQGFLGRFPKSGLSLHHKL